MPFMSLFRPNSDNVRILEFSKYKYGRGTPRMKNFKVMDIPLAIFHLTEMGPSVLYRDFDNLIGVEADKNELTNKINVFAANIIAATGSGHSYNEGCFDLKFDNVNDLRVIVIAIKRPNIEYVDRRIKTGYFHIVLFIPKKLAYHLPSISKMEESLFNIVAINFTTSKDFNEPQIVKLKKMLINKINEFAP